MGFGVSFISRHHGIGDESDVIRKALYDAEKAKKNETIVTFNLSKYAEIKVEEGQVVHYASPADVEVNIRPRKVWVVAGVDDDKKSILFKEHIEDYYEDNEVLSSDQLNERIAEIKEAGFVEYKYFLDGSGRYWMVKSIEKFERTSERTHNNKLNPHRKKITMEDVHINVEYENRCGECETMGLERSETMGLENLIKKDLYPIGELSPKDYEDKLKMFLETGGVESLQENLLLGAQEDQMDSSSALVDTGSKQHLEAMVEGMEEKRTNAIIYSRSATRKINIEKRKFDEMIKQEMGKFDLIKQELAMSVAILETKIKKIGKLIATIEVYAGIEEEIIQIAEGENAPDDVPINIRQMMLFYDEEIAAYGKDSLDFKRLDDFDAWLVKGENYKRMVPDDKCVVIGRLRRDAKDYGFDDPFANMAANEGNHNIYLLIRNGGNVYRIYTKHISTAGRMFPKRDELQEILQNMQESKMKFADEGTPDYSKTQALQHFENSDEKLFAYKKNFLLLHGLISRTDIFTVPVGFSVMDIATHDGAVNMIYDEENTLSDGRPKFWDWLKNINETLEFGSRVFLTTLNIDGNANDWSHRFTYYWANKWGAPNMPHSGVYQLKKHSETGKQQYKKFITEEEYFKYREDREKSKGTQMVSGYGGREYEEITYGVPEFKNIKKETVDGKLMYNVNFQHEETGEYLYEVDKNQMYISYNEKSGRVEGLHKYLKESSTGGTINYERNSWRKFIINRADDFIINFDELTVEDLQYYITSRLHRRDYMRIMPVLIGLRDALIYEKEKEKGYVGAMTTKLSIELNLTEEQAKEGVIAGIQKWKDDLTWKRPLPGDEPKSLNNIELKTLRFLKKKHKLKDLNVSGNSIGRTQIASMEFEVGSIGKMKLVAVADGLSKKLFLDKIIQTTRTYTVNAAIKMHTSYGGYGGPLDHDSITKVGFKRTAGITEDASLKKLAKQCENEVVVILKLDNKILTKWNSKNGN